MRIIDDFLVGLTFYGQNAPSWQIHHAANKMNAVFCYSHRIFIATTPYFHSVTRQITTPLVPTFARHFRFVAWQEKNTRKKYASKALLVINA